MIELAIAALIQVATLTSGPAPVQATTTTTTSTTTTTTTTVDGGTGAWDDNN